MSNKYKFRDQEALYFITSTVVNWIDLFTRRSYKDIIIESLKYCQEQKGLKVYGYVTMTSHIHLIIGRKENAQSFSELMRDFKKYTSMKLIKAISENPQESRKEWLLWILERAGKKNSNNARYQLWQQDNHPIELKDEWIDEKLSYIHQNPVVEGWVTEPEDYFYSSARNYAGLEAPMKIDSIHDGIKI